ncbi:MAG: N-6 DNA methylase [Verrucomicrobia bacterium]|nr:N-6 DNA methylase [Verrucomicrobiota bacterium]
MDAAFLAEIERWRKELAQNLALRNPALTQRELNFAVQRIIDRIIFLRICEDRGIEDYGQLRALLNGDRIYPRLARLFEQADRRYNSGLFHFKKEPGRHESPDELTLSLNVDDKLLRDILRGLYYPESPYEFSVLSADILGQVYEQFLGKVIRLTPGHRVVVDDKPEVKKAGGVYYTPTYIVDYIVRQTVGKLLDDCARRREPAHSFPPAEKDQSGLTSAATVEKADLRRAAAVLNRAAKLRILDPACGSGSFLMGAYQYLLDWHLQFYLAHNPAHWAKGGRPALVQTAKGWQLTIAERKRILLANLYGVDIDAQAVEVTKLSLLLKVLEGETGQTLQTIFRLFAERALPDLGNNIKCGNSLIGPDFYQQAELPELTDEERYRINVFDWHAEFPEIFRSRRRESAQTDSGGELRETPVAPLDYTWPGVPLHGSYSYKKTKRPKAVPPPGWIEPEWEVGFDAVIGNPPYGATLSTSESDYLRNKFKSSTKDLDTYTLFMEQAVMLMKPAGRLSMIVPTSWYSGPKFSMLRRFIATQSDPEIFVNLPYDVFKAWVDTTVFVVTKRTKSCAWPRKDVCNVNLVTFPKRHRIVSSEEFNDRTTQASFSAWFSDGGDAYLTYADVVSTAIIRKITSKGKHLSEMADIQRGVTPFNLTEEPTHESSKLAFKGAVRRYRLDPGGRFFIRFDDSLAELKPERYFVGPRLLLRELISRQFQLQAVKATQDFVTNKSMQSLLPLQNGPSLDYLLGVINSRLMSWYFLQRSNVGQRDDFPKIVLKETRALPVVPAHLSDKTAHDRMVKLVEAMLALHQQLAAARTPQEQTALERQIAATDAQIDRLVYDLYGLTEDEIKIVEGQSAPRQ